MKINKVNIIYSRTVQMRQFEPATVSVSMEAQIDPTDQASAVIAKVKKLVKDQVEEELQRLKVERRESFESDLEKAA